MPPVKSIYRRISILLILMGAMGIICSSCGMIVIKGYYSDYKKLTEEEKAKVLRCKTSIDSLNNDGNIYIIDTLQIRNYLNNHHKVFIYEWSPLCHAQSCISPTLFENFCMENELMPCIIITIFDFSSIPSPETLHSPILFIDTTLYKTDVADKYCKRFFDQLTGIKLKKRGYGRFHLFKKGKFIKTCQDYFEAGNKITN